MQTEQLHVVRFVCSTSPVAEELLIGVGHGVGGDSGVLVERLLVPVLL